MTAEQIIFLLTGAVVLGSALMVVTTRNLLHAALWLVVTLFRSGSAVRHLAGQLPGSCPGGDLYRCDCHPVHLCGHA